MTATKHNFTEQELESVRKFRAREESAGPLPVDDVWRLVGQIGYYYGWEGVQALKKKKLKLEDAKMMIAAAEVIEAKKVIDMANAMGAALSLFLSQNKSAYNSILAPYMERVQKKE